MMRPSSALHYIGPLQEISSEFVELLSKARDDKSELPDDTIILLHRWALESISRIFLDARVGSFEPDAMNPGTFTSTMVTHANTIFRNLNKSFGVPFFKYWPRAVKWYR